MRDTLDTSPFFNPAVSPFFHKPGILFSYPAGTIRSTSEKEDVIMNNNWEFDYSNLNQNNCTGTPQSGEPMNNNQYDFNNGAQPDPMAGGQPPYSPMGMQPPKKPGNGRGKRIACAVHRITPVIARTVPPAVHLPTRPA